MTGDPDPHPQPPEPDGGFRAGGTPGGRWGCALAGAVVACCVPLVILSTWVFRRTGDWLLYVWLPMLLLAAAVGLATCFWVNAAWRRRGEDSGGLGGPIAAAAALAVLAVVLYYWWWSQAR